MEGVLNNGSVSQQRVVYYSDEVEQAQQGCDRDGGDYMGAEPCMRANSIQIESRAYRIACLQQEQPR